MADLSAQIQAVIKAEVKNCRDSFRFREPIIGFARADDPLYEQLDDIIGTKQLHPKEILPSAQSVVVYFIPFSLESINKIQGDRVIWQEWSDNYTITNALLTRISKVLMTMLMDRGVATVSEPPTNNFDPVQLTAKWAHKASAVIAGIGTFGLNRLVITPSGTAGRLGSLIMDAKVPPTARPGSSYCLYYKTGRCQVCVEKCPTGALSVEGFDRFRCNAYLDGKNIHDLQQGCGMCSSGPCAAHGFC